MCEGSTVSLKWWWWVVLQLSRVFHEILFSSVVLVVNKQRTSVFFVRYSYKTNLFGKESYKADFAQLDKPIRALIKFCSTLFKPRWAFLIRHGSSSATVDQRLISYRARLWETSNSKKRPCLLLRPVVGNYNHQAWNCYRRWRIVHSITAIITRYRTASLRCQSCSANAL